MDLIGERERPPLSAGGHIPHADPLVLGTGGGQSPAVGRKRELEHPAHVRLGKCDRLGRAEVQEFHNAAEVADGHLPAIRRILHRRDVNRISESPGSGHRRTGGDIPEAGAVVTGRGQRLPVGREGEPTHVAFVAQPRRPQARAGVVRKLAIGRFREFGRSGRRRPSRVAGPIAATLDADFWTGTGWCQRGSERHQG